MIGPSVGDICALDRMDNSYASSEYVTALDENFIHVNPPNLAQPSSSDRSSHFVGVSYRAEGILSTLSRSRLEDTHRVYQVLELVTLRVPAFNQWASSFLPNEVSIFEQALDAGL